MRDGLSASDVALLTNRNNDNNGFGNGFGDGAWWIIILFLFVFCGWGNNGWSNNGNGSNGGGVMDAYVLNSDFATLQRLIADGFTNVNTGINQVNNGLCDGFFNVANSFANTNQNIMQTGYALNNAINGVQNQIASCCCDIRQELASCCCTTQRAIDGVNYNMAMNTNAIQNTLCNNTRDIIESNNANYRALHDEIVANRIEDKNAQIQAQQNEINALRLAASQERQNNYLISELKPKCPEPAYVVQPPQNVTFPTNCCGNVATFSGCNCGNY